MRIRSSDLQCRNRGAVPMSRAVFFLLGLGCSARAIDEPGADGAGNRESVETAPPSYPVDRGGRGESGAGPSAGGTPCLEPSSENRRSIPRTVSYSVLWQASSPESHPRSVVIDEGSLYWSDTAGNIWTLDAERAEAVLLRASPGASLTLVELIANADHLYFVEAALLDGEWAPPSRLMRVPKGGGEAAVVFESKTDVVAPFGVVGGRVLVKLYTDENDDGHWQIEEQTGTLSELPVNAPSRMSRVVNDHLYWLDPVASEVPGTSGLWRAPLSGLQPEHLMDIRGTVFHVGPGYVLSRDGTYTGGPATFVGQRFVKLDEASGCVYGLPGISGASISPTMTADETHAYWQRDNSAQTFSPDNPPLTPLFRTNLEDGLTEKLETPGLVLDSFSNPSSIIGQDADHVYLMAGSALVRVDKP